MLGLPPAFTLSQDQTLHLKLLITSASRRCPGTWHIAYDKARHLRNGQLSTRRRPHKLSRHTVKDLNVRAKPESQRTFRPREPPIIRYIRRTSTPSNHLFYRLPQFAQTSLSPANSSGGAHPNHSLIVCIGGSEKMAMPKVAALAIRCLGGKNGATP